MDETQKKFVQTNMRQASYKWPPREAAKRKARIRKEVGTFKNGNPKYLYLYKCAGCGGLFTDKEIALDHVLPVVPVEGWRNEVEFMHEYLERLLVYEEGFQVLCREKCHQQKSDDENNRRRQNKKQFKRKEL